VSALDDRAWLVIADRFTEAGNPLGEYIVLELRHGEDMPVRETRRQRQLVREWNSSFAPWSKFVAWSTARLTLRFKDSATVLAHARELKDLAVPLELEIGDGSRSLQRCVFDEGFTRLAWTEETSSVENQNHSPGMDETWHHWTAVKVWRVADGVLLYAGGVEGRARVELRPDGVWALENGRAQHLHPPLPPWGRGLG